MKRNSKKWLSFDFGTDNADTSKKSRKKDTVACTNSSVHLLETPSIRTRTFDFHAALKPKCIEDVAVHPKKLKELEEWLQINRKYGNKTGSNGTSILLLTGPTGCGKTTALSVTCKKLGIFISEWTSPVDQDSSDYSSRTNQIERFTEFLTESKWKSLFNTTNDEKIILVEDFPNAVVYRPEEFFNILEECSYKTKCPLVFICTDSLVKNGIQLSRTLFPQEIRDKYCIDNISFNSCADTLMKTVLKRAQAVAEQNTDLLKVPSMPTVSAIIASSMGDIRCAVNQYYLASLIGSKSLPTKLISTEKVGSKRKRGGQSLKVVSMNRDETLGLFHGLGRVLNPKRKEAGTSWRLNCDVEKLIEEFSTQPSTFTAFLFENYMRYFGDFSELSTASDMLSMSQLFLNRWQDRHDTMVFALWVAVLGVMIANKHRVSRWNPIQGPKKLDLLINNDMRSLRMPQTDLYYYNIINKVSCPNKFSFKKSVL